MAPNIWHVLLKVDSLGQAPCFDSSTSIAFTDLSPTDSSFVLNNHQRDITTSTTHHPYYNTMDACSPDREQHERTTIYPNPTWAASRINRHFIQAFTRSAAHYQQQCEGRKHATGLVHRQGTYVTNSGMNGSCWNSDRVFAQPEHRAVQLVADVDPV